MRRTALRAALAALTLAPLAGAQPPSDDPFAGAPELDRGTLIVAVLARNTSLQAALQAQEALAQRVPQVTALPDPMLMYGIAPLSPFDQGVRFGQSFELRQRIPLHGKRRLAGEAAQAETRVAEEQAASLALDLALAASRLFDDYHLVDRRIAINREHLRLVEGLKTIATARYAAGVVPQAAPLAAEVELAHLTHRDFVLGTQREVIAAQLNALLHRHPGAPLPPPIRELPRPSRDPLADLGLASLDSAVELVVEGRPELAEARAAVEARRAEAELARLERKPDVEVGTSYNNMWNDRAHRFMVGGAVQLPIRFGRLRALEAEADARLAEAQNRLWHLEDELKAQVIQIHERALEAHHVSVLYDSRLLPAARDQLAATRAGFETGQSTFLDLLEAERAVLAAELAHEEVQAAYRQRRAELARALGQRPPIEGAPRGAAPVATTGMETLQPFAGELQ
jgi:outer membrane protein TolC